MGTERVQPGTNQARTKAEAGRKQEERRQRDSQMGQALKEEKQRIAKNGCEWYRRKKFGPGTRRI